MTWVVGGRHVFCARCLADVQVTVTWKDARPTQYVDAVKKVYILRENLIVAFSGTIRVAFEIIDALQRDWLLRLEEKFFSEPGEVIRQMARHVRRAFDLSRREDTDSVKFLVFIVGTQSIFQQTGVYKIASPSFGIEAPKHAFELLEIGSGAGVEAYREFVERHSVAGYKIPDPDSGQPTLVIPTGKVALRYLHAEAAEIQTAGISQAMHLMLTYFGNTTIDQRPATPDSQFPKVAESWGELVSLMRLHGIQLDASDAIATA